MESFPYFLEAVYQGEWEGAQIIYERILKMGEEAKRIRYHILLQLTLGHLKRVTCAGVFELLGEQHKLSEEIKQLAAQLLSHRLLMPRSVAKNYHGFIYAVLAAIQNARIAVDEFDKAFQKGLENTAIMMIKHRVAELEQLGKEVGMIQQEMQAQVSALAPRLPMADLNLLHQIFERTGKLASQAQLVGYQLQRLVA